MRSLDGRFRYLARGILGVALAAASATAGCSGGAGQRGPAPGPAGLRALAPVPCPGLPGFSCGTLSVALDPSGSVPGRLSLRVAMSRAPAPRGVLVLLTGGPGQPGVPFAARLTARLGPAVRGYRLVLLDQRGTGAGALACPALQREMGASDLTVPAPGAVRSCAAAIGPDRRFFATADTVADLEALRRALGVRRLALDGVSYGSYVAAQFALAHPRQVSRLILDSVVPAWNADPLQLTGLRRTATVLRAVCAAQGCSTDPARDLAAVVRRYHDGPALFDTLVTMSVGAPSFPGVPAALHAAAAGDPAALRALMARVRAADAAPATALSQGLHASTLCADLRMPWGGPDMPLASRRAALARAAARLTPAQVWPFDRATAAGNGLVRTCLSWPPMPATPPAAAPRSPLPRVPVLLLAGGRDLSTPLPGARAQAALAPGSRLVVFPAAGHSVQSRAAGNPALAVVRQFLTGR
ncbi:MAG TPA: alpha/beta fold hydrolase [Streptosporangiaceae bacterium]|nr:alpha/beta fold hydrolase [Streptosporangiaceae bacterium]